MNQDSPDLQDSTLTLVCLFFFNLALACQLSDCLAMEVRYASWLIRLTGSLQLRQEDILF
jgi:hypothetical protein